MQRWRALVLAVIAASIPPTAQALAREELWRQDSASSFSKGHEENVVVSDSGVIRLGRALGRVGKLDEAHVWDLARSSDGALYASTGDHGKVYRKKTDEDGWQEILKLADSQVLSLAVTPEGRLIAGTGPGGHVVEWENGQKSDQVIHDDVRYVWDLALDRKGTLWAATGPSGQLWKRPSGGEWARVLDSPQPHLLCLVEAPDGSIYAGSDGEGLIYRISPQGKVSVMYDAEPSEIHALTVGPDGAVYAASAAESERSPGSSKSALLRKPPTGLFDLDAGFRLASLQEPARSRTMQRGENAVFRVAPDGSVREIFRAKALLYALTWQDDRLLVGSGPEGVLYEVRDGGRDWSSLARIDHGQVLCLRTGPKGEVWMGAGDPGGVRKLEDGHSDEGTFESDVFDAHLVSRFGALNVEGTWPEGTSVSIQGRSGNVARPDETWSDWSKPVEPDPTGKPQVPPGRFAQYRLKLSTHDRAKTPEVRSVTWLYRSVNQAPEVSGLTIPDLSRGDGSSRKPRFELGWTATDPNHDTLTYRLAIRKEGWPDWIAIGGPEPLSQRSFEWDTTTVPDGVYRLRVSASDRPSNPESEALERAKVSDLFVVDHEAPSVTLSFSREQAPLVIHSREKGRLTVQIRDDLTRIVSAEVAIDSGPWSSLFPEDGLFDSRSETLHVPLGDLKGAHVVVVRAIDAAGNVGSRDMLVAIPDLPGPNMDGVGPDRAP
jgi:hypothetical protein